MDVQGDRCLQKMLKKDLHLRRKQQHRRGCWCWWRGRRRRSEELEMDEDEEGLLRRGRGSVVCRKREKKKRYYILAANFGCTESGVDGDGSNLLWCAEDAKVEKELGDALEHERE